MQPAQFKQKTQNRKNVTIQPNVTSERVARISCYEVRGSVSKEIERLAMIKFPPLEGQTPPGQNTEGVLIYGK